MTRHDGRMADRLRPLEFELGYQRATAGSALISLGNTRVLCSATIEENVPHWMRDTGRGWVTAEYSMLPGSSGERIRRERRGAGGRTMEIQRLIGRSLRAVTKLDLLGERSVTVDCDVIDADGGTRTASIIGATMALHQALTTLDLPQHPMECLLSAISVGIVDDHAVLDLDYIEDSGASVDMNVVMDERGFFVELQGTGEEYSFSPEELQAMLDLAATGNAIIINMQREALGL
ncbi:MAG: ribonuclease PH [bacterium]|nr:ribonuclease PH [bacterium]